MSHADDVALERERARTEEMRTIAKQLLYRIAELHQACSLLESERDHWRDARRAAMEGAEELARQRDALVLKCQSLEESNTQLLSLIVIGAPP